MPTNSALSGRWRHKLERQRAHFATTAQAIQRDINRHPDAVLQAMFDVMTQGQQDNVLRTLGWEEKIDPVPPKLEQPK